MTDFDFYTPCAVCGKNFGVVYGQRVSSGYRGSSICPSCRSKPNAKHLANKKKVLTIRDIMELNRKAGQHWFSKDTMAFFKSRIPGEHVRLENNRFFITSEKSPFDKRKYSIREWKGRTKSIDTVGDFNSFNSKAQAQRVLNKLMQGKL